jgi:hypothetical protein
MGSKVNFLILASEGKSKPDLFLAFEVAANLIVT